MPPRKGTKRKPLRTTVAATAPTTNGNTDSLTPPDRNTWPGWVEMESEPAFFNVMLKEMGARGVKVQEVYSMDADMLAILPQPVHGLIFLFKYRTSLDQQVESGEAPSTDHIWFANQIPDFACASVALLNIVNNIPGLEMGKELRDFKNFTQDLDPHSRGQAIDSFHFVRKIHNSFARDNDLLQADMHMKNKMAVFKRKEAAAKGRATKAAKKAAALASPLQEKSANGTTKPGRTTRRSMQAAADAEEVVFKEPSPDRRSTRSRKSSMSDFEEAVKPDVKVDIKSDVEKGKRKSNDSQDDPDGDFEPDAKKRKTGEKHLRKEADDSGDDEDAVATTNGVAGETPQADEGAKYAPEDVKEVKTKGIKEPVNESRRSTRARKPPKKFTDDNDEEEEAEPEEGFHFIAYVPIDNHVWKLDGLNYLPEDMGTFGVSSKAADGGSGNWLDVVGPAIMGRMAEFEGDSIEFSLMAVVHDLAMKEKADLVSNVKALQAVEDKLTAIVEDWNEMEGGETKGGVVKGMSPEFNIIQADMNKAEMPASMEKDIEDAKDDLLELLAIRKRLLGQQDILRAGLRDAMAGAANDDKEAKHRRHDYAAFVRKWMGALAENEVLGSLIDG